MADTVALRATDFGHGGSTPSEPTNIEESMALNSEKIFSLTEKKIVEDIRTIISDVSQLDYVMTSAESRIKELKDAVKKDEDIVAAQQIKVDILNARLTRLRVELFQLILASQNATKTMIIDIDSEESIGRSV